MGFQQQELMNVKQELKALKEIVLTLKEEFEDRVLSEDDKAAIDEALQEKKKGKLLSKKKVFENA